MWRIGGGDLSRGETGHRGDSLKCSWVVGDFTGAPNVESDVTGRRVGVVVEESVLVVEDVGLLAGLPSREGLTS